MDSVKDRIAKAMEISGYENRSSFAKFIKISYPTINKWIERDSITDKGIIAITSKVDISQDYLKTGEGDPYVAQKPNLENLSEEELIAMLPKDVQQVVKSYKKLPEEKKREQRQKLILEASEIELEDER